jgi:hypothetical protein
MEPPVCILGRPLGDLDFSMNFGVSQSSAGDVVEKHRENGEYVKERAESIHLYGSLIRNLSRIRKFEKHSHEDRKRPNWDFANIFSF